MEMAENKTYSFADYLTWENDVYAEAINGRIISMSPSPTPKHQAVVGELTAEFKMFLRGKRCAAFVAPMDVCLFAEPNTKAEDILDWVQPDLFIVCDPNKVGDKNIVGAPDLIIEVLSSSTAQNDRLLKFKSYKKAGVSEYWIVDPHHMTVEIYQLTEKKTFKQVIVYGKNDTLVTEVFPGLKIDLNNIFQE